MDLQPSDPPPAPFPLAGREPAEVLALCEVEIGAEAARLSALEQGAKEAAPALADSRYRLADLLLFLSGQGLLALRGCESLGDYQARCWRGPPISFVQLTKYLRVADRGPRDLRQRAGIELLDRIARIEGASCRDLLFGLLRSGARRETISRGAQAALRSRGLPEELVLQRAQEALGRPRQRRAEKDTELRLLQDRDAVRGQVLELLEDAARLGRGAELSGWLADLINQVSQVSARGAGPAALPGEAGERRRTLRDAPGPADAAKALLSPDPAPPAPPAAAPRPPRRAAYQEILPVAAPALDEEVTPAELSACRALTALHHAVPHAEEVVRRGRKEGEQVADDLMLHYQQVYSAFAEVKDAVLARVRPGAEAGRAERDALLLAHPGADPASLWPLATDPAQISRPAAWLVLDVVDPFHDPAPSGAESRLLWVLALLRSATSDLEALWERLDEGDGLADALTHQLCVAIAAMGGAPLRLRVLFHRGAREAERVYLEGEPERQARRAQAEAADANLVVLCDTKVTPDLVKVGTTADGRHVAISLHTAIVIVVLGLVGTGKSHLGVLLAEGLLLDLPGLNRRSRPGNVVVFAADWRKGHTRRQHLRGFGPNPDLAQWDGLREQYAIRFGPGNAAYCRAILSCLPGTAARYRAQYPDLIERGLEIREARLHSSEWTGFAYSLFLSQADKLGNQPQYQSFIGNLISTLGEDASPARVQAEFRRSKLGGASRAAVEMVFEVMKSLTSEHEHIRDLVREPGVPVFCYHESTRLGAAQILSLDLSIIMALNRELPGDPYILYILEEVAKQAASPQLWRAFEEMTREVRHGRRALLFGAHLPTDLPADVLAQASGIVQFRGTSPAAHRQLGDLQHAFRKVPMSAVAALGLGAGYGVFKLATSGLYMNEAQLYQFRPSCIDAGGETMTRG